MSSYQQLIDDLLQRSQPNFTGFPSKQLAAEFADRLFQFLFGTRKKRLHGSLEIENEFRLLQSHLQTFLQEVIHEAKIIQKITEDFFAELPAIYDVLQKDAQAILDSDPAAKSIEEVLIAYPGFFATAVYRFAHQLHVLKVPVLPRLLTEHAHSQTGIDIHPGARIGHAFSIDHGTGVVIGETTVIGNNVKIYQGVTLGALNVTKGHANAKRHPTVEDNVIIYSGSTILGGETVIGRDSIIGGNVFLTYSIPSSSVVYHKSEIKVKDNNPFPEPLNFVI
ncbi:serine O-acetyltransferase [Filimonas effusa]|uniref:Serine acetyltransferase n=1 Tax=Filimonas effusa TaxID=2508721 RepID=A0A4Q1D5T6_9BACT|nr:serine acetyltransferase [Filimonas effusa]RXK83031.1 serine acetyltransferase [Filimonas effusa]